MTTTFEGLPTRVKPEVSARDLSSIQNERTRGMREDGLAATAEQFVGVTENGKLTPGLFPVHQTGVSTAPIKDGSGRCPTTAVSTAPSIGTEIFDTMIGQAMCQTRRFISA